MPDEPIDMDPDSGNDDGISRRRMLKRIGVVTAVAWATPVVTSLRTPAFADAISPGGCPCFSVCGDPASDCFCLTSAEGASLCGQNFICGTTDTCGSSDECPPGYFCQAEPCIGNCGSVCVPLCGEFASPHGATVQGAKMNR